VIWKRVLLLFLGETVNNKLFVVLVKPIESHTRRCVKGVGLRRRDWPRVRRRRLARVHLELVNTREECIAQRKHTEPASWAVGSVPGEKQTLVFHPPPDAIGSVPPAV